MGVARLLSFRLVSGAAALALASGFLAGLSAPALAARGQAVQSGPALAESGATPATSPPFENDETAYTFFVDKGLGSIQAAAIVGNLDWESHDDPAKEQKRPCKPCGEGIAQWSIGSRWNTDKDDNMLWFAKHKLGKPAPSPTTLKPQLDFVWYELNDKARYGLASLKKAADIETATEVFMRDFEICRSATKCNLSDRILDAETLLAAYGTSWKAVELPLPGDKSTTSPSPTVANIACTSGTATSCAAVGSYANNTGDNLAVAFIDSGSGTSWHSMIAPLPGNATNDNGQLTAVACGTTCAAIGQYQPKSGSYTLIEAGSGDSWTALTAPMPDGIESGSLNYVACAKECVAAGSETGAKGKAIHEGVLEVGTGASWTESIAPLPKNAATSAPGIFLDGAACGASNCAVYGTYQDKNGTTQGLLETESGGKWTVTEIPYPKGAGTGLGMVPTAVACQSSTKCTAVAEYSGTKKAGLEMIVGSGTSWKTTALPGTFDGAALDSISCATKNSCTAVGAYMDESDIPRILTVTGSGSKWKQRFAPLPPHKGSTDQWVWPQSGDGTTVACATAYACTISGTYYSTSNAGPFLSSTWRSIGSPVPGNAQRPDTARFNTTGAVACPGVSDCVAVGWYAPKASIPSGYNGLPYVAIETKG